MKDWAMEHWFLTFIIIVMLINSTETILEAYFHSQCCDEHDYDEEDDQALEEEIDEDKSSKSS